jgi:hypothetical protein
VAAFELRQHNPGTLHHKIDAWCPNCTPESFRAPLSGAPGSCLSRKRCPSTHRQRHLYTTNPLDVPIFFWKMAYTALNRLQWGLMLSLLAGSAANAAPSVNVGLEAAFPAGPYLLELLFVWIPLIVQLNCVLKLSLAKPQLKRTLRRTFHFSIAYQAAISLRLQPKPTYTPPSSMYCARMATSRGPNPSLPLNSPYLCDLQPLA